MRNTEYLLEINKITHRYEKYWAPFENKEKLPYILWEILSPFENT